MPELTPEIADQVVAACSQNAQELAEAFSRALGGEFALQVDEQAAPVAAQTPAGGGLVVALAIGESGALAILPEASGLVPEWVRSPDETGRSKLGALAQELGMLLLPEGSEAETAEAAWVDDLAAAVSRARPATEAVALGLGVTRGESLGTLSLAWPCGEVTAAILSGAPSDRAREPVESDAPPPPEAPSEPSQKAPPRSRVLRGGSRPRDLRDLPPNTRSLLRVNLEVSANLAGKKVRLSEVIELGPGSIITFNKPCDDPLELSIGARPVARGEAVKVGERFGVRVLNMILPEEHFRPLLPPSKQPASAG
ncbi:FliM/FliN family flagellar motor C-terminal domain-containing protein [Botrimarina sp.]|uniref:FliM/FliN family flagellar motor C-terminal domain-containing protein n=1 Tax=Botrimarina sp. TaxID=2795802 RepID=UPI0032EA9AAF